MEITMQKNLLAGSYPQQSLWKSIVLHILPGALVALAFVALKPFLDFSGYPPLLSFLLVVLVIDVPFMWGVMLYEGWKKDGRLSLNRVVLYREKVSWKRFLPVFVGAFIAAFLLVTLSNPLSEFFTSAVSSNLPKWIFLDEQSQYQIYARDILIVIFVFQLVVTGIVLPWTEELYFRGYLLPRITRFGKWTPLIGGLLFGLYHIWQLFGFASVFLLGTVLGFVVWWQRDVRLGISLHIISNVATRMMILITVLQT